MNLMTAAGSALVVVLAVGSFPFAQAATLNSQATAATDVAATVTDTAGAALDTSVSADVTVDGDLSDLNAAVANLTSGAMVTSQADLEAYTEALLFNENSGSANTSGSASADVSGSASGEGAVSGDASANASGSVKGAYVSDVAYAEDGMTVSFRQPARFLWLIPTTVTATAEVSNSGEVTLNYPWYSFLMATNRAEIAAAIEARIASVLGTADMSGAANGSAVLDANTGLGTTTASASASTEVATDNGLSPRARAQVLDGIRAVVHEIQADGSLVADASGSVDLSN